MPIRKGPPTVEGMLGTQDERLRALETHQHDELPSTSTPSPTGSGREYATVVVAWSDTHEAGKILADVVGTGSGDQSAISEAISLLPASGGEIVMLEGTAVFSATPTINVNDVHLRGMGTGTVFNRSGALATYFSIQADRVRLSNFKIASASVISDGITISSTSDDVTVAGVHLEKLNTGVLGGGPRTRVQGCTFLDCSTDIKITNSAAIDGIVTECTSLSTVAFQPTFAQIAAERWSITTNVVRGKQAGSAILLAAGANFSTVVGNILEGTPLPNGTSTIGIASAAVRTVISSNTVRKFNAIGISCSGSFSTCANNLIDDTAEGPGISLSGDTSTITGNTIFNCRTGIRVNNAQRSTVSSNSIYLCDRHGIEFNPGAFIESVSVIGNSIIFCGQETDNTYDGIFLTGSGDSGCDYCNIQSNLVKHSGAAPRTRYGINISHISCDGNLVTNNFLFQSGATASLNNAGTGTITAAGNVL